MADETRDRDFVLAEENALTERAFPVLTPEQIEGLCQFGKKVEIPKGGPVWRAGQENLCMFVVLSGVIQILEPRTRELVAQHAKGGFSGDIDVLSGRPTLVDAVAKEDLELLEIPGDCVRSIVGEQPETGRLILDAFLARRAILQLGERSGPLIIGSRYSADTLRVREFLVRNHFPSKWEDLEDSPNVDDRLREFGVGEAETPIVVLPTGAQLFNPTNEELGEALGVSRPVEDKLYDLVIVGAGPAGLAAAVYGASEGLSTLVVDERGPGGQAGTSSRIENYMGFPSGLSGQDLADRAVIQAERFGAQMVVPAKVVGVTCTQTGAHEIHLEGMTNLRTRCVILASGASYRTLDVPGIEAYEGKGIYYSATGVERLLCGDEAIAVVGAGNSAGQAAVFLSESARKVFLVVRGDDLRKTMSSYLARRIESSAKIEVLLGSEICGLQGEDHVEGVAIVDKRTGKRRSEQVSGVFVMIGAVPHTSWLPETVARDSKGFVLTGRQVEGQKTWSGSRQPYFLETSCPGVFAAGDVRSGSVKRVASSVGEGSMAVALVHQYLAQSS